MRKLDTREEFVAVNSLAVDSDQAPAQLTERVSVIAVFLSVVLGLASAEIRHLEEDWQRDAPAPHWWIKMNPVENMGHE